MGDTFSRLAPPVPVSVPVSVSVVHPFPDKGVAVAGYVSENRYTLTYTLLANQNDTVAGLLRAMGQFGPANGTGVTGVSATAGECPLRPNTRLIDGTKVYLSFLPIKH